MIRITWLILAALIVVSLPGVAHANGMADLNAAVAAQDRGDLDQAIQLYTRALQSGELTPENQAVAYNNRGGAYIDKRDYDAALRDFNAVLGLDPNVAKAYNNRALAYEGTGDYEAALRDLDTALQLDPKLADAYYNRGRVRCHNGDYDAALRLDPNHTDAYYNRGLTYGNKGDYDAALRDYDAALRLRPDDARIHFDRGVAYLHKGNNFAALRDFDAALRVNSELGYVVYARGIVRFAVGRFADAAADFAHARQLAPPDPYSIVWLHLSRVRAGQADAEEFADGARVVDQQTWAGHIVAFFLGELSADQLLAAAEHPDAAKRNDQRCAADFFVGEKMT